MHLESEQSLAQLLSKSWLGKSIATTNFSFFLQLRFKLKMSPLWFFFGYIVPICIEIIFPLFVVYKISKNFQRITYYAKFTLYCFGLSAVPVVLMPYFLLSPRNVLNFLWVEQLKKIQVFNWTKLSSPSAAILRNVSRIIGIKYKVRGDKYLRKEQSCVIVANHQSRFILHDLFLSKLSNYVIKFSAWTF